MSPKELSSFECLSLKRFLEGNNGSSILLWGLLCVLMLTLLSLGLMEVGDQFEYSDFSPLEGNLITWGERNVLTQAWQFFFCGTYAFVLFIEYLRSHIGEKRPVDYIFELRNVIFRAPFPMTALENSAVFSCYPPVIGIRKNFSLRRSEVCVDLSSQVCSKKNFLC